MMSESEDVHLHKMTIDRDEEGITTEEETGGSRMIKVDIGIEEMERGELETDEIIDVEVGLQSQEAIDKIGFELVCCKIIIVAFRHFPQKMGRSVVAMRSPSSRQIRE